MIFRVFKPGETGADNRRMTLTLILFLTLLAWAVYAYNRLIRDRNRVRTAWSDIDVQLRRRYDLVPNLVKTVQAYASYEKSLLSTVTELRERARATDEVSGKGELEIELARGVDRLIALAEAYPDLKANRSFLQLQTQLAEVEDHLQYARRYYNGAVRNLNTRIESFPDLIVARLFGFRQAGFFQAGEDGRQAIRVKT